MVRTLESVPECLKSYNDRGLYFPSHIIRPSMLNIKIKEEFTHQ